MMRWLRENESVLVTVTLVCLVFWFVNNPRIVVNLTDCPTAGAPR